MKITASRSYGPDRKVHKPGPLAVEPEGAGSWRPSGRPCRAPFFALVDLCGPQGRKRGREEEAERDAFWRGTAIDIETRLRVGRDIANTSYVERTNLTSRHIDGRLARKPLSFLEELETLKVNSGWEDAVYNLTRPVNSLRLKVGEKQRRCQPRSLRRPPA
jgi:hypothetical protein